MYRFDFWAKDALPKLIEPTVDNYVGPTCSMLNLSFVNNAPTKHLLAKLQQTVDCCLGKHILNK